MATTEDCYVDTTSAGSNFPETRSHDSGGPNDDDQSLDAFDDFFNSRSSVGQNGQRGLGGPEFTSTPNARRLEGETTQTYSNTTMSSSNSPTASPATSRRTGNRQRSMRKAHQRTSNRNTMFVSENNNQGSTNQLQGSTNQLQSSNSIENAGRHSSVDNHVESAASTSAATANGFANMQGKIQQLENDLRERGEQILQLRRDNRKVQARVDESGDALSMAQATHEKLLEDMQSRCKRQVDAAQRNVKMELEESQEMIQELSEQLQIIQDEASREKTNADKYKHETEKVNDRLQVTNSQLVEVSSQCQKLTEAAMMKDRDNRGHMDMQRLENVQSEEALQNYQKQIYELQLELEQAKNDTSLQLEINRLRSQVASQNEDNDDLKAQLLKQNIVRAKELAEQSSNSLAAEIETADRRDFGANSQEIIEKLTRDLTSCKSNNEQLRQYLDKILQSILEKDPSILEVK